MRKETTAKPTRTLQIYMYSYIGIIKKNNDSSDKRMSHVVSIKSALLSFFYTSFSQQNSRIE